MRKIASRQSEDLHNPDTSAQSEPDLGINCSNPANSTLDHLDKYAPEKHLNDDRHFTGYCREKDLPALLALWPHEIDITCATDHEHLLQRLMRELRAERQRGIVGHWTYNLTRHCNLVQAYRTERDLFRTKWAD